MAVEGKRKRYISFVIEGGSTERRGMISAIRRNFSSKEYEEIEPWLTVFTGEKGIIRCDHRYKERAVEILNGLEVGGGKVKTLITSGTIKKAKKSLEEG
ncbi:MAG: hypothetical protein R6U61_04460 [Thermoplasmata archaeon]